MNRFFTDLLELFYPSTCIACGHSIPPDQQDFCATCIFNIAYTNYDNCADNELTRRLIAIRNLKFGVAPFYFSKESPIQKLLYKIKYKGRQDLAHKAGQSLAKYLLKKFQDSELDAVTYVPLHVKKYNTRGYNQSEILASEIAQLFNIPLIQSLTRTRLTETQTHFGRHQRLENQKDSLRCNDNINAFEHILLVDDVLTTGATLESCADAIRMIKPDITLSICTLAIADDW